MPNLQSAKLRPNLRSWTSTEKWKERIITFDPSWFLVCMGTGICVQLLASSFPFPARWLNGLGYAFWILDIVLFAFFTCMSLARVFLHLKVALSVFDDFQQTCYLGAVPTAWETIVTGLIIFYPKNETAIYIAQVFFWIAILMTVFTTCGSVFVMHRRQGKHRLNDVTGAWLVTFIPMIVGAAVGSNLAPLVSHRNGVAVLVISFLMLSLGLGLSFLIMGIYFWRLMACQLPDRDIIVSTFVLVGPVSMSAYVIANLSKVLAQYIVQEPFSFQRPWEPSLSPESMAAVAEMILWLGVISALFLLGIGTFFLIEAFAAVVTKVPRTFNIGLWSVVFPCGVYANGFCRVSTLLRNDGMKGWGAACVTCVILLWLMCATITTYEAVWRGKLFYATGLQGWVEQEEFRKLNPATDNPTQETADSLSMARDAHDSRNAPPRHSMSDGTNESEAASSWHVNPSNSNISQV